jgi:predicted Ser/Thr protein kinase
MGDNPYAAQDPLITRKMGRFRLEKRIGEGGMGAVYLGTDGSREVAIKVLPPQFAADAEHLERFLREIRVMAAIDHPHVVKVIDAGETDKIYWLAMEYVQGKKLSDVMAEHKRLPFDRAARMIREIAKGLAAAHAKDVVHRDVKPQNVLVPRDGKPRLIDFGLAREPGKSSGLTQEGTMMGTPEYMSPEQVEGKKTDKRTDIYSLGVTFYQLLSGKLPFGGENAMQMAMARLKEEPRDIRNSFPGVDPRAIPILAKMLQREPGSRYGTMEEFIDDIEKALAGKGTFAPASKASGGGELRRDQRRQMRGVVFGLCCLAACGLALYAGMRSGDCAPAASGFEQLVKVRITDPLKGPAKSTIVTFLGAALAAFGAGFLLFIADLKHARRVSEAAIGVPVAAAICFVSGAMLSSVSVDVAASPVNRGALAVFLIVLAATAAFRQWPAMIADICAAGSAALFYWAGAGKAFMEPFQALGGKPELAIPMLVGAFFVTFFGAVMMAGVERKLSSRVLGMVMLLAGGFAVAAFGSLKPDGGFRWTPTGVVEAVKLAPMTGAFVAVSLGILLGLMMRIADGLMQSDAYYGVKESAKAVPA